MSSDKEQASKYYLAKLVLIVTLTASAFGMALVTTDELADAYAVHDKWTVSE